MNAGNWPAYLCSGLNASMKYAYSAPDLGTTVLSSAKASAPQRERIPHVVQIIKHSPIEPDLSSALVGDTNIPDPAIIVVVVIDIYWPW